jgi:hypothetical protein
MAMFLTNNSTEWCREHDLCSTTLETKWAALVSYGVTARLLHEVLPIDDALAPCTIREHVFKVAERLEQALGEEQWTGAWVDVICTVSWVVVSSICQTSRCNWAASGSKRVKSVTYTHSLQT